jgi:hypothetical protein
MGFHEGLDRHSRHQLDLPETRRFRGFDVDPNCVVALAGSLILRDIGGDTTFRSMNSPYRPSSSRNS